MIFQLPNTQLEGLFQFWGFGLIFGFLYLVIRLIPKMNKDKQELKKESTKFDKESGLPIQRSGKVKKLVDFKLKKYTLALCFSWFIISFLMILFFIFIHVKLDIPPTINQDIVNILGWIYFASNIFGTFIFLRMIIYYIEISTILTEVQN